MPASSNDSNYYYDRCISLLQDVKLLDGPLGLSNTLRRHSSLKKWLFSHQRSVLHDIELDLDLISNEDYNNISE